MIIADHKRYADHHTLGLLELKLWPGEKCLACGQPDLCEAEWVTFTDPLDRRIAIGLHEPLCVECLNWYSVAREVYAPGVNDADD